MVADLRRMGIRDERVLEAVSGVERHRFVPDGVRDLSYADGPLPIGHGQTISQPYMVAAMSEALELTGDERVLEIGTGSGYQCAVLSRLAAEVISVERIPELAEAARNALAEAGCDNVRVVVADGTQGVPEYAPYDAVLVTAGAPGLPQPLAEQLAEGGVLVIPEGGRGYQTLTRYRKRDGNMTVEALMACVFVPLLGAHGWME